MSGEGESAGEKSFEATPQRLAEARAKGDVPKSTDATAAAGYLALLAALSLSGAAAVTGAGSALMTFLANADRLHLLAPGGPGVAAGLLGAVLVPLAPLFLAPAGAVALCLFAQRAVVLSGDRIRPKAARLSLLANARNRFGPDGLVEFAKGLVKLLAIAGALLFYLSREADRIIGAAAADPRVLGGLMARTLVALLAITAAIATAIGAADLVWQRLSHARKLRMTLQEVKEEHRRSEGDAHVKGERRRRGQDFALNQMLIEVPKAAVVIVNPTHYAVALRWSRAKGSAPVCVAKGVDAAAARIREAAEAAGVPIHDDPPTARALHATVEIGQEIRPEQYRAVAAAVRFADRMRAAARGRP
ncbi:EscU/YscU/HrcU family type III secretion system export apparatus switch protein [Amaricoccus solimangrovi]|uniref:Flagellar type III secretion system protein FlhB n=1 Tax=Amaricoccus solimangrovi TaxID=2589815 RepID=A0A501WRY5_9RHOB|nr:EscU/YscU/HrcU family type III secretion system export apparatus switch protein [Amaricoccus solimangrovi]TPE52503.1 flagellar type III secretion system protein FlhB [Amaricoccus solimangrovi]